MKGILFAGGLGPLLQDIEHIDFSNAVLVAADSGFKIATEMQIECDYLVGDIDSISPDIISRIPEEKIMRANRDKDETDTELGYTLLRKLGCRDITIIGGGAGRFDHELAILALFERRSIPARWITHEYDMFCLDAAGLGWGRSLGLTLKKDLLISVLPLGEGPWHIQSSGLFWELDAVNWHRGYVGISNRLREDSLTLSVNRGRFLIMTALGNTSE